MIIVTGAKRSGTSMMMQMAEEAGFHCQGEKYPKAWADRGAKVQDYNPDGFYEVLGIVDNGANNLNMMHPPKSVEHDFIKIFSSGLPRTDGAYLEKVVLCIRDWRDQVRSWKALKAANTLLKPKKEVKVSDINEHKNKYPDGYEWFYDYYQIVKDLVKRRYPLVVVDHDDLIDNTKKEVESLKAFFRVGRWDLAGKKVRKDLREKLDGIDLVVSDELSAMLDSIYEGIKSGQINQQLLNQMDAVEKIMAPKVNEINEAIAKKAAPKKARRKTNVRTQRGKKEKR